MGLLHVNKQGTSHSLIVYKLQFYIFYTTMRYCL